MMGRNLIKDGEIEVSNLVLVRLAEVCSNSGRVISLRSLGVRAQEGGEGEEGEEANEVVVEAVEAKDDVYWWDIGYIDTWHISWCIIRTKT